MTDPATTCERSHDSGRRPSQETGAVAESTAQRRLARRPRRPCGPRRRALLPRIAGLRRAGRAGGRQLSELARVCMYFSLKYSSVFYNPRCHDWLL